MEDRCLSAGGRSVGRSFLFFIFFGRKQHKTPHKHTLGSARLHAASDRSISHTRDRLFPPSPSYGGPPVRHSGTGKTNGQLPLEAIVRRLKINLQLALPPPPLLNTSVHSRPDRDHESASNHILLETMALAPECCSYTTAPALRDAGQLRKQKGWF